MCVCTERDKSTVCVYVCRERERDKSYFVAQAGIEGMNQPLRFCHFFTLDNLSTILFYAFPAFPGNY